MGDWGGYPWLDQQHHPEESDVLVSEKERNNVYYKVEVCPDDESAVLYLTIPFFPGTPIGVRVVTVGTS